jgi:broad specificity phosphatase PhoE
VIAFTRHGQTAHNRDGRLQGRVDLPLSELGAEQAAALARQFEAAPVARVVSSPLQRAAATATTIAAPHGLAVEIDERLVELDYGEWDGRPLRDVPVESWAKWRSDPKFAPPGGERLTDVTARIANFTVEANTDDFVVAVSHVSPIKAAICVALDVDERATWRMQLDVASVCRLGRRPDGSPFLLSYNETAHLLELA